MEPISKRILINPSFKVSDDTMIKEREGCCSMHGFSAIVPRSKEIVVSFLSEDGKQIVWRAKDWTARILQHEIEHLEGKVFIMHAACLEKHCRYLAGSHLTHFSVGFFLS